MRLLLLLLFPCLAFSQGVAPVWHVPLTTPTCDAPPFYQDFSALSSGSLDGQSGWDDKSGAFGTCFIVVPGSGVYGNEPTWTTHKAAIDTGNCVLTSRKQWGSFIYKGGSGGSYGGSGWGIALRSNSAGDSIIWCTYDKASGIGIGTQLGTSNYQFAFHATTLSDGDSVTLKLDGENWYLYKNTSLVYDGTETGLYNSNLANYAGITAVGDEGPTWYIVRWRAGTW